MDEVKALCDEAVKVRVNWLCRLDPWNVIQCRISRIENRGTHWWNGCSVIRFLLMAPWTAPWVATLCKFVVGGQVNVDAATAHPQIALITLDSPLVRLHCFPTLIIGELDWAKVRMQITSQKNQDKHKVRVRSYLTPYLLLIAVALTFDNRLASLETKFNSVHLQVHDTINLASNLFIILNSKKIYIS